MITHVYLVFQGAVMFLFFIFGVYRQQMKKHTKEAGWKAEVKGSAKCVSPFLEVACFFRGAKNAGGFLHLFAFCLNWVSDGIVMVVVLESMMEVYQMCSIVVWRW